MKKITLKSLDIKDFKGIKNLTVDFGQLTTIKGDNGLGKTSIFDAFTWLLFDKDSKNRNVFDIKPLDENNKVIRGLTPAVTGVFEVNEETIILSKTYKEKWTKRKGEAERVFTGNETKYEINSVPVKKKDYTAKIDEMVDEEQFKLLSNPHFFSLNLNWKDARDIIIKVAGDVTPDEIVAVEPRVKEIIDEINSQGFEMVQKSKKASSLKLAKEKKEIPVRINEIKNSYINLDFNQLEFEKEQLNKELEDTNLKIQNELKHMDDIATINDEINNKIVILNNKKNDIISSARYTYNNNRMELQSKLQELNHKLSTVINNKKYDLEHIENINRRILNTQKEKDQLGKEYISIQAEIPTFNELQMECPTCKRTFDSNHVEVMKQEIIENFNTQKAKRLERVKQEGLNKKNQLEKYNEELKETTTAVKGYDKQIDHLKAEIENVKAKESIINSVNDFMGQKEIKEIENIGNVIKELESQRQVAPESITDTLNVLNRMKDLLNAKIVEVQSQLDKRVVNNNLDARIEELKAKEKELGQNIVKFEKGSMLCELYMKTRVKLLESRISSKFRNVSFKMFREQVNGILDETCEALIDGVPFSMANSAAQINAGLDIINTLSRFYDVSVPVFIDNAETINNILKVDNQLIKLEVSWDKELTIKGE